MAQKMLIDATHPEETRVVVADGNKVEEFDFESINKRQLAGNIYLAKVTRVEPSLQAAFVDYGGNRHGFLAFAEIHPDYYQIPVADREKLLAEQAAAAEAEVRAEEEEESRKPVKRRSSRRRSRSRRSEGTAATEGDPLADPRDAEAGADVAEPSAADAPAEAVAEAAEAATTPEAEEEARADDRVAAADDGKAASAEDSEAAAPETPDAPDKPGEDGTPPKSIAARSEHTDDLSISEDAALTADAEAADVEVADAGIAKPAPEAAATKAPSRSRRRKTPAAKTAAPAEKTEEDRADTAEAGNGDGAEAEEAEEVESIGAEDMAEEIAVRRPMMRRYKIQEVIKVRQILLVQVVKEERGNKGAALTTYLSLPGRYCVLMPNTARGGGISRKITNA
ncbi:MAG: ribonuclease E/G, partial [Alphaproteobacteria bacterium]